MQSMDKTSAWLSFLRRAGSGSQFTFAHQINGIRAQINHRCSDHAKDGADSVTLSPTNIRALPRLFTGLKQRDVCDNAAIPAIDGINAVVLRCHINGILAATGNYQRLTKNLAVEHR